MAEMLKMAENAGR